MQFVDWRTSLSETLLWLEFVKVIGFRVSKSGLFKERGNFFSRGWSISSRIRLRNLKFELLLKIFKKPTCSLILFQQVVFLVFYLTNKISLKHFFELVDQCPYMEWPEWTETSPPIPKNVWGLFYWSNKKLKRPTCWKRIKLQVGFFKIFKK